MSEVLTIGAEVLHLARPYTDSYHDFFYCFVPPIAFFCVVLFCFLLLQLCSFAVEESKELSVLFLFGFAVSQKKKYDLFFIALYFSVNVYFPVPFLIYLYIIICLC